MGNMTEWSGRWKPTLIIGSLLAYLLAVTLNAVFNIPGISPFNETIGDVSRMYPTPITPSDETFDIWGAIYIWLLIVVIYCMTLLCRKCDGTPLYISPGVVPSTFFLALIINLTVGNPGWIVVWLEQKLEFALALLVVSLVSLVICLYTSCQELERSGSTLERNGLSADIWCTRIIVQNGIAFYLAWVSLATGINAIVVLHYVHEVDIAQCCFGILFLLNVVLLGWFILGIKYDRQLRYVFAHYITYGVAFFGVHVANFDPDVTYQWYALVIMILSWMLALAKLIIIIVRSVKDPIHYPECTNKTKFELLVNDIHTVEY